MAYTAKNSKGTDYYLNTKKVQLKYGGMMDIYYFSRDLRPATAVEELPAGKEVVESKRSRILMLKNITPQAN